MYVTYNLENMGHAFLIASSRALRYVNSGECSSSLSDVYKSGISEYVQKSGNCFLKGREIQIEPEMELIFGTSVILVAISVFMLHRFIQEYAFSLLDRKNHVTNLSKINEDLRTQVKWYIFIIQTFLVS
jgi:hypothetical protein